MIKKSSFTIAVVTMLSLSSVANAQECGYSARRVSEIDRELGRTVLDYPGTHAGFLTCAATADNEMQRSGSRDSALQSFVICMGVVCMFAGFDSCATVTQRWYTLSTERARLQSYLSRYC
jgi:hypothetical protein